MFPRHQLGLAHQGAGTFISHVGHRNQGALLVLGALANQNTVGGQRVESRSSLDPLALASRVREKGPRWLSFEQRVAVDELRAFGLRDPQLKPQVPIRLRRSSAEPVAGGFFPSSAFFHSSCLSQALREARHPNPPLQNPRISFVAAQLPRPPRTRSACRAAVQPRLPIQAEAPPLAPATQRASEWIGAPSQRSRSKLAEGTGASRGPTVPAPWWKHVCAAPRLDNYDARPPGSRCW